MSTRYWQPFRKSPSPSQKKRDQYEGEALFLRALCYFNLVRMFGDVVYIDRPITIEESQKMSRTAREKVYSDLIIPDLKKAKKQLPDKYSGEDIGRSTSGAAQTLLGKVYLTQHDYENCAIELGDLIEQNRYQLLPKFADIFNPDNANHAESIFEIQYEKGYTGGSQWSCQAHSRDLATTLGVSTGRRDLAYGGHHREIRYRQRPLRGHHRQTFGRRQNDQPR